MSGDSGGFGSILRCWLTCHKWTIAGRLKSADGKRRAVWWCLRCHFCMIEDSADPWVAPNESIEELRAELLAAQETAHGLSIELSEVETELRRLRQIVEPSNDPSRRELVP